MRVLLLIALLLSALPAAAGHRADLVDVQIIDRERGRVLDEHFLRGERWVAGRPGHRYAVRLVNRSGERVLAVLSVDGVNAVSGETASAQQTGYVLGPWQSLEVTGWRKSLSDVAAFEFTALGDSYAARTGRPDHVGVIGVAVFRERVYRPRRELELSREAPAPAAPSASDRAQAKAGAEGRGRDAAPMLQESLGTGHGPREWSAARHVAFERDSTQPSQLHAIRYDSERNLMAMGVIERPRHPRRDRPEPFPIGFVPDP